MDQYRALQPRQSTDEMLVVDLDGTLIRTDMLYETFWSALSRRFMNIIPIALASRNGKAALKRRLAELASVDAAKLPFNEDVVAYVQAWRGQGGKTALVSAADEDLVRKVVDHIGPFDEVHGSDGTINLKGARKAAFLAERFPNGFVYIGDASADLDVWKVATRVVTVDISTSLQTKVDEFAVDAEHLTTRGSRLGPLVRSLRPHQWLKNVLVFLPMMAAHQFDVATIFLALLAFVSFSLIASSVYLLNDLLDLGSDRAHPRKRLRPLASGQLPLSWGTALLPLLLLAGFAFALVIGPLFVAVIAFYCVVTTAYSFNLKRRLVVDICTLAGLYTLRLIAGSVATQIPLSVWFLAFSIFFFFSLAAMKRQAELVSAAAINRKGAQGRGYQVDDLPLIASMAVSSGYISVLVMALYLNSPTVQQLYRETAPLWGICLLLLYWISRMVMMTHRGWMHDDPVVFAAKDKISIACGTLIFALAGAGVWM